MASKQLTFTELIVQKIDEYTDKAFETQKPEERQKCREVVKLLQDLVIKISLLN